MQIRGKKFCTVLLLCLIFFMNETHWGVAVSLKLGGCSLFKPDQPVVG